MKIQLTSEFCCVGSIYSMKLLGFLSKAIKLLLTEWEVSAGIYCPEPFPH